MPRLGSGQLTAGIWILIESGEGALWTGVAYDVDGYCVRAAQRTSGDTAHTVV
jgi:hypothetical protein